ncbi:CRISPR-associated protein, Csd1 family [Peptoclostridium litorale DSM 5388]|uniref:CRISPR-associated protein, Csd1 family n=1 Tax=Peptoclostridium litorale DSM 5388 TaxID=1121324 RepID=A0A069RIB8_PEPLI|nr:type I-C CRISPR-associated protein Cas8c/Csd1 [Peptoclostridium litorale]KDR96751.1 CRISPR-associated protein, Csd1 family [Peptoclostridium litorale DSM 5388]SIO34829.1 CRISPR-associated protein, Csd1 family [Peptoclostridium litorale DSM 5388]
MIIDALKRYYEILAEDEKSGVPPYGYSSAKVGFAFNISLQGKLLDVIPLKEQVQSGKKTRLVPRIMIVPEQSVRAAGIKSNFMCDNSTYVMGVDNKGKPKRSIEAFEAFKKLHEDILKDAEGDHAKAVLSFLNRWEIENAKTHPALLDSVEEIMEGSNIVFKLDGNKGYIHEDREIKSLWDEYILKCEDDVVGQCLITGEYGPIERIHPNVKNVKNAQSSGASIVSFNELSYESYGKKQSYNSPIGKYSAFAYTAMLNHMLSSNKQKIQVGDATTVFWAESPEEIYRDLAAELFNPFAEKSAKKGNSEYRRSEKTEVLVKDVISRAKAGMKIGDVDSDIDPKTKFYILGLSPNAARISIRFFHADSFGGFVEKTVQHYRDLEIVKDFKERTDNIPMWMLLQETASPKGREKEVNPLLAGSLMRSIVNGAGYPSILFNAIMGRIRADMDDKDKNIQKINYVRASIIKAYLTRKARIQNNKKVEEVLTVSLNENATNVEYLLGRLFAVLEKAQQDANPGINATIKDRYFSSASATPAVSFPILLRLAQHHVSKSEYGYSIDRKIEAIMDKIGSFPAHLTLEQQGIFVLGYYHQRVALFQKSSDSKK